MNGVNKPRVNENGVMKGESEPPHSTMRCGPL